VSLYRSLSVPSFVSCVAALGVRRPWCRFTGRSFYFILSLRLFLVLRLFAQTDCEIHSQYDRMDCPIHLMAKKSSQGSTGGFPWSLESMP
jgi:hypothetical protein